MRPLVLPLRPHAIQTGLRVYSATYIIFLTCGIFPIPACGRFSPRILFIQFSVLLPEVFQPTFTGLCSLLQLCFFRNLILLFSFLIDGDLENPPMPSPFNPGRIGATFGLTHKVWGLVMLFIYRCFPILPMRLLFSMLNNWSATPRNDLDKVAAESVVVAPRDLQFTLCRYALTTSIAGLLFVNGLVLITAQFNPSSD